MDNVTKVHKFGGTSVRDGLDNILSIVSDARGRGESAVLVVSALAEVTNLLLKLVGKSPMAQDEIVDEVMRLHLDWLRRHSLPEQLFEGLEVSLRDALRHGVRASQLVAYGERFAALGVATALQMRSIGAAPIDTSGVYGGDGMVNDLVLETTDGEEGNSASPLELEGEEWGDLVAEGLLTLLEAGKVPVCTGFIGRSFYGCHVTNLGRGGSDYTATLFGAALARVRHVDEIVIWSDVPGMCSANPKVVADAHLLLSLSYGEASEFAHGGGKLHPETLRPAAQAGIPIRMASTQEPDEPGTRIGERSSEIPQSKGPLGVVYQRDTQLITVRAGDMSGRHGVLASVTHVLDEERIIVDLVGTGDVEFSLSVRGEKDALERAKDILEGTTSSVEFRSDVVLVTALATRFTPGQMALVFLALEEASIEPLAISMGSSCIALQMIVDAACAEQAVRAIHAKLFPAHVN